MLRQPQLLPGHAEGHQQDSRPGSVDASDQVALFRRREIAVPGAGDDQLGIAPAHVIGDRFGHARPRAQQEQRQAIAGGALAQPRKQIGAVDVGGKRETAHPATDLQADAVRQHPRRALEHGPVAGIVVGDIEAVRVDERQQKFGFAFTFARRSGGAGGDPVHRLVHGGVDDRHAEEIERGRHRPFTAAQHSGEQGAHDQPRATAQAGPLDEGLVQRPLRVVGDADPALELVGGKHARTGVETPFRLDRHRRGFPGRQRPRPGKGHVAAQDVEQHRQLAADRRAGENQSSKRPAVPTEQFDALEHPAGSSPRQHAARQPQRRQRYQ